MFDAYLSYPALFRGVTVSQRKHNLYALKTEMNFNIRCVPKRPFCINIDTVRLSDSAETASQILYPFPTGPVARSACIARLTVCTHRFDSVMNLYEVSIRLLFLS